MRRVGAVSAVSVESSPVVDMTSSAVLVQALVVFAAVCSLAGAASVAKLPKDFKRCKKHDPKLSECLKNAIQNVIPSLQKGVPSLGLMTVDPLRISSLKIDQGSGPVSINLQFNDLDIKGVGSVKVDQANADWDKYYVDINVTVKNPLSLQGRYNISGKVLILPIQGAGRCNLTLQNTKARVQVFGKPLRKNNQVFLDVEKLKLSFQTEKLFIDLENLFNGDKALGANMLVFLNENWQDILKELQPSIEEALGQAFRIVANRIFHKVPLNQIYIE